MRPNLSLESIAGALAVLGTGVIMAACGGDPKTPVNANEVSGASEKAGHGDGHCGAGKDHKPGEASCSADKKAGGDAKPADTSAAAGTSAAATPAADAKPADAKPADATSAKPADAKDSKGGATPATPATPGKKGTTTPATPATPPAKKGGGASCGAGTCGTKK
jgi:hypothetical protein